MPLASVRFASLRPFLYHLTARRNLDRILAGPRLLAPTMDLLKAAGRLELLRQRRRAHVPIVIGGQTVVVRDQAPLHAGNIAFQDGFALEDLVEMLNLLVYFWPGAEDGPIIYGSRHFQRYQDEDAVVLKIPLLSLREANPLLCPQFSSCNSGSPRCNPVRGKAPRGPRTFLPASSFEGTASDVVEVVFAQAVLLPGDVEVNAVRTGSGEAGDLPTLSGSSRIGGVFRGSRSSWTRRLTARLLTGTPSA
ncbi:hypothetical protein PHYC_03975 [Phycisphaerales bacterium]|nr:hypothetical protein PHYC_03975 [Phycisphaerales bacterium]